MDLMALSMLESRRSTKFTVLSRKAPWTEREVGLLINGLICEAYGSPAHPNDLILFGEYTRDRVVAIIGECFEEHKNVTGYENPELPFRPPI